ncbi:hypothetical protein [[Acholeplasma] multilocale]|uniref:hypothetical protein n=1 Tax=[Acholeplasma] multilocale TaxID=264638 RepID=UPI00047C491F|nr:hypothetical protein [[Acholeplasma] multilocale]
MISLEYFLDKKSLNKVLKDLDNGIYYSTIPAAFKDKLGFTLKRQLKEDRYLFDYLRAYNVTKMEDASQEMRLLDLTSLLIIDGEMEDRDSISIRKSIIEINSGRRPSNKDEKMIWNVVEVFNLIQQDKFEINEDNYELFIHILFRNIGLDLDTKRNYYRSAADKTFISEVVAAPEIDNELTTLFEYINSLKKQPIGGFTQAYLIALAVLIISPYKRHNLIVAMLLSQWFVYQTNQNVFLINPMYCVGRHWSEVINYIEDALKDKFIVDEILTKLRGFAKEEINISYRMHLLDEWINKDFHKRKDLFDNKFEKLLFTIILGNRAPDISAQKIKQEFVLGDNQTISKTDIELSLKNLIDKGVLILKKGTTPKYAVADPELLKIKLLLSDEYHP